MIDFHSHVLSGIDDGSESVEESVAMLAMLGEQGVTTVCATPHFDASRQSPDAFLEARAASAQKLAARSGEITVLQGAEVAYYPGISRMEGLERLRLEGTRLLLLEMPMTRWSEYLLRELADLSCAGELCVVLAHVERYWHLQGAAVWDHLLDLGFLMQANGTAFLHPTVRRGAFRRLKRGEIHLLGSDCHGQVHRPPRLGEATLAIEKRLGRDAVEQMDAYALRVLRQNAL